MQITRVAALGFFLIASQAVATTPVLFTDRASFDAAVGPLSGFESFEGFLTTRVANFGDFTATSINGGPLFAGSVAATDGFDSLAFNPTSVDAQLELTFDSPVSAFGFDIASFNLPDTQIVTIEAGGFSAPLPINGPSSFFGSLDPSGSFTSITFSLDFVGSFTGIGIDAFSFGTPVPEPSSFTALCLGLLLAGGHRFRNR